MAILAAAHEPRGELMNDDSRTGGNMMPRGKPMLLASDEGQLILLDALTEDEAKCLMAGMVKTLSRYLDSLNPADIPTLSVRAANVLRNNGLVSVRKVRDLSLSQVERLTRCGRKTRTEIYGEFLKELNITLPNWSESMFWHNGSGIKSPQGASQS